MRKKTGWFLSAVFIFMNFALWGSSAAPKPIVLKLYSRYSDDHPGSLLYRKKIQEFNALHPDIRVQHEAIYDENLYIDKLRTSFATGDLPNIFIEYGGSRIIDYVANQKLVDLQPFLDADQKWNVSFRPVFDKWRYPQYKGTFGIPFEFYGILIYYNKAIFNKLGLKPPRTLAEFEEICPKLKAASYIPMALGEKDVWRAGHIFNNLIMKSFGAQGVTGLANRTKKYDSPEIIKLYAIIQRLNSEGVFGPDPVSVDYDAEKRLFQTGKSAMHMDGSWFVGDAINYGIFNDIGTMPFPALNQKYRGSFQGGAAAGFSVTVNKDPKVIAAAVKFLKYMTSVAYFKEFQHFMKGGICPVKFDPNPAYVSKLDIDMAETLKDAKEFRDDVQTYDSISSLLETVRSAIQGLFIDKTPEQCGAAIVKEIKAKE